MSLVPRDFLRTDDFFAPFFSGWPFEGAVTAPGGAGTSGQQQLAAPQAWTRSMPVDVVEKEDGFQVKADIPGVSKEDINISVDKDVLRINVQKAAEKEEEKEEGGAKYYRYERSSNFVGRALRMPDNADLDQVRARYENGVLMLDMPKREKKETHKRITVA